MWKWVISYFCHLNIIQIFLSVFQYLFSWKKRCDLHTLLTLSPYCNLSGLAVFAKLIWAFNFYVIPEWFLSICTTFSLAVAIPVSTSGPRVGWLNLRSAQFIRCSRRIGQLMWCEFSSVCPQAFSFLSKRADIFFWNALVKDAAPTSMYGRACNLGIYYRKSKHHDSKVQCRHKPALSKIRYGVLNSVEDPRWMWVKFSA